MLKYLRDRSGEIVPALLSLSGFVLSLMLWQGWCFGSNCSKPLLVLGVPLSLIGVLFYLICLICLLKKQLKPLKVILPIGVATHIVLIFTMFNSGHICNGCIAAAGITFLLFASVLINKNIAQVLTVLFLCVIVSVGSGYAGSIEKPNSYNNSKANYGIKTRAAEIKEKPEESSITVYTSKGNKKVLELKDGPVLYFGWWCSHCDEALRKVSEMDKSKRPRLVSIYIGDDKQKNIKKTVEKLQSTGLPEKTYYKHELDIEAVPAIIKWNEKEGKIILTGRKAINSI